MTRTLLLLAFLLGFAGPTVAQEFDGLWNVDVNVRRGECPEGSSFPVRVAGGRIAYAGNLDIDAGGTVAADGRVSALFRRGPDRLNASGRLTGRAGSGQWTAPTRNCAGTWRARRL